MITLKIIICVLVFALFGTKYAQKRFIRGINAESSLRASNGFISFTDQANFHYAFQSSENTLSKCTIGTLAFLKKRKRLKKC